MSKSCVWNYVSIDLSICLCILPPFHRSKSIFLCIYASSATATSQFQLCKWSLYGHGSQKTRQTAPRCNTWLHTRTHGNALRPTTPHCNTLQHTTSTHLYIYVFIYVCISTALLFRNRLLQTSTVVSVGRKNGWRSLSTVYQSQGRGSCSIDYFVLSVFCMTKLARLCWKNITLHQVQRFQVARQLTVYFVFLNLLGTHWVGLMQQELWSGADFGV